MDENKPRSRWLSFGIRDLLWAMALVAMGLGWWQDRQHLRANHNESLTMLFQFLEREGMHVTPDSTGFKILKGNGDMVLLYRDTD